MEHTEPAPEAQLPRFQLIESGRLHVSHIIRDNARGLDYPTNAPQLAERAVANIATRPSKYAASPTSDDAYMAGRLVKDVVS